MSAGPDPDARTSRRADPVLAAPALPVRAPLQLAAGKAVPPAVFMTHQVITPENVDHFYPNDSLLAPQR